MCKIANSMKSSSLYIICNNVSILLKFLFIIKISSILAGLNKQVCGFLIDVYFCATKVKLFGLYIFGVKFKMGEIGLI